MPSSWISGKFVKFSDTIYLEMTSGKCEWVMDCIIMPLLLITFLLYCSTANAITTTDTISSPVDALHRLLRVFGMDHPGRRHHHHLPPQYMVDLYNAIADSSGISKTTQPYRANIVRSFSRKNVGHQQIFYFNLSSSIPAKEEVLAAEFHLYKMKYTHGGFDVKDITSNVLEVRIYQILNSNSTFTEEKNLLLNVRKISTYSTGWEVFKIKQTVKDWLKFSELNYGLLVTVRNSLGKRTEFNLASFARNHRHDKRQPLLVIFTDDHHRKDIDFQMENEAVAFHGLQVDYSTSVLNFSNFETLDDTELNKGKLLRLERAVDESVEENQSCTRHKLQVDLEKLGWSSWIISPKWYNAYFCRGNCAFPLGQNQWPTNHATVQSIVHELKLVQGIGMPCCVPNKLFSINLLYFDEHENVILKQYDDMVAASCGCH